VVEVVDEGDRARRERVADVGETWDSESLNDFMAEPFSSVLSREGAARREAWDTLREALGEAWGALWLPGVEGSGLTVTLERALSVLELVMELKREPSFRPIVTSGSRADHRSGLLANGHRPFHIRAQRCSGRHFNDSGRAGWSVGCLAA